MELEENKKSVGRKRRRVKPKQIEFQRMVSAIVNTQRLHCEFRLQKGIRHGKNCDKAARRIEFRGAAILKASLCSRHIKYIAKHSNVAIVDIES
jgi:hypothetical protein